MEYKIYLKLLPKGYWAKKSQNTSTSTRTLRFDITIEDRVGKDYTDLETKEYTTFSLRASPNISGGSDQYFDRIVTVYRDRVPANKLADFDRLYRLWKEYHLNDLTAGTKKQEDCVAEIRKTKPKATYDELCELLKAANLFEDNGYKYGHGWLFRPIPSDDINFIKRLCEEWKEI